MGLTVPQNPGGCKERGTGEGGHTVYMGAIHSTLCTVRHIDNLDNQKITGDGLHSFFWTVQLRRHNFSLLRAFTSTTRIIQSQ